MDTQKTVVTPKVAEAKVEIITRDRKDGNGTWTGCSVYVKDTAGNVYKDLLFAESVQFTANAATFSSVISK